MAENTRTTTVEVVTEVAKDEQATKEPAEPTAEKKEDDDNELNDLLDSALKDFDKPTEICKPPEPVGQKSEAASDPLSEAFAEEFSGEMAKQFEEAMKNFMPNDPSLMQQIEQLAEKASNAGQSTEAQQEFASTLTQTLSSLAQNSEGLEEELTEDELMKAFTSMGMEDSGDGFMPMMQGMMQTLLSKDVLYPSLKEMSQKYPKWLKENQEKTPKSDYQRYEQQHEKVESICKEFEKEQDSETEATKKLRFERIVDLMQQMQELGQPPKEIVGDMAPGLEFDESGMPKLPTGNAQQCNVM